MVAFNQRDMLTNEDGCTQMLSANQIKGEAATDSFPFSKKGYPPLYPFLFLLKRLNPAKQQ